MSWTLMALLPFLYGQRDIPQEWSQQNLTRHTAQVKAKRYFYDVLINNSCSHMKIDDDWASPCSLLYACFKTYIAQLCTEIPYLHSKQGSSKGINACFACTHLNLSKYLKSFSSSVKRYLLLRVIIPMYKKHFKKMFPGVSSSWKVFSISSTKN